MGPQVGPLPPALWTGPRDDPRRYRVETVNGVPVSVGDGGEGLVYRARRQVAGDEGTVALKMHTTLSFGDFERFTARATALSEIDHPTVMRLVDVFVGTALIDDDDPPDDAFTVMYTVADWIPGLTLPTAIEASSKACGLHWVAQIARAAGYLHDFRSAEVPAGIVHRDIKPSNVRITPDEDAVLIDFGIARPHREGDHTEGAGTYLWRAPEVVGGPGEPGPASDAWGIGALAYWVLLAEPPRLEGAAAARELLGPAAHAAGFADAKGIGRRISELLETQPERRPSDLSRWADEMELRAAGKRPRRPARLAGIAAVVLLLAGVLIAVTVSLGGTPPPSPSQSRRVAIEATAHLPTDAGLGTLLSLASYVRSPTVSARRALVDAIEQPLEATLHDGSPISSIAYNRRGTRFVTGDSAGNVIVWNTATGVVVDRLRARSQVTSVSFSPSGRSIAAGDIAGVVDLWDTGDRATLRSSLRVGARVTSVAFSSDGTLLAIGTVNNSKIADDANGKVVLWDLTTGQHADQPVPDGSSATSVAFDPSGFPLVAFGTERGDVDAWYLDTHPPKGSVFRLTFPGQKTVSSISFSPDGQTLAADYGAGSAGLWTTADFRMPHVSPVLFPVGKAVTDISFSPDGHTLAASYAGGTVKLWNTSAPSDSPEVIAVGSAVSSVTFSPNGEAFATGDISGNASLWDPAQKITGLTPRGTDNHIDSVAFSGEGDLLAAADYGGDVTLWNANSRTELRQLPGTADQIPSVALDRDGQLLATGDVSGHVALWDTLTGKRIWLRNNGSKVFSVSFSPNGRLLAAGDNGHQVVLWNTLTGTEVGKPLDEPDKSPFRSVAFSPNGAILAAGDDGGGVTLWRTSDRRPIGRLLVDSKPRNRSVRSVAFSPDGTVLATGAEDGSVTLWNVASGDQVRRFDDHSQVLSLGFSHDGESLATGDSNGAIVTWNLTTGTASSLPTASGSQVYSLAFSSDDATLAAANDNASVTVLPSIVARDTTQELAASLCRRVTGNLTQAEWNRYVGRSPYQTVCPAY